MSDRLRGLGARLRALLRRGAAERELEEELRFHLEMETEAGIGRGLEPGEARRQARVRFGGVERYREEARAVRRVGWADAMGRDLRHALRLIGASPWFTVAAVATLALGIGANTAIFSVVNAVLLAPTPFPEPDRLVMVWETDRQSDNVHEPASWPDVEDFRSRSRTLAAIGSVMGQDLTLLLGGRDPERVAALGVTPNLIPLLGVQPLVGRTFTAHEGDAGSGRVVMLGEGLWRERFDGNPAVVGRTITLDGEPATVVGVMPAGADLGIRQVHERADYAPSFSGDRVEVWLAARPTAEAYPRSTHPFLTLARLEPGVSLAAAQEELSAIARDLESLYPVNEARGVNLEAYSEVVFGPVRPALLVLLGAVGLVLLVTCANVASLLLARTRGRAREVAVRRALGAAPARIRGQFLVEALVLASLGTAAGVALAHGGLRLLVALAPPDIPRLDAAAVDGTVLLFTAGITALVTVLFGLLPALEIRRIALHDTLKARPGQRGTTARGGRGFRAGLVIAEVALTVTLVVAAGVLLRSLWELQGVDPGFDAEHVLKAQYELPDSRYPRDFSRWPDIPEINDFHARLLEEVRSIPGVEAAAIAGGHPLDPGYTNSFTIVGREAESGYPEIRTRFLTAGYLETLGVELVAGRAIRESDDARATPVVLINRVAAERYFPGGALGQQIAFWGTARTIVGIIGDERFRGLDAPSEPAAYAPLLQNPHQSGTVLIRTAGDPTAVTPELRRRFRALDPQLALFGVEPLEATVTGSLSRPRFLAMLLSLFAGVAVLLALVGLHGVLSYTVARRAPELGIRMALGASRWAVLRSILAEGLALAALGTALGLLGALAASRLLASVAHGISPTDPATLAAVVTAILATAAAASLAPALRATRVDAVGVLRAE